MGSPPVLRCRARCETDVSRREGGACALPCCRFFGVFLPCPCGCPCRCRCRWQCVSASRLPADADAHADAHALLPPALCCAVMLCCLPALCCAVMLSAMLLSCCPLCCHAVMLCCPPCAHVHAHALPCRYGMTAKMSGAVLTKWQRIGRDMTEGQSLTLPLNCSFLTDTFFLHPQSLAIKGVNKF